MSNASELMIKINGDAKNAKKAFDDVRKQTEDLEGFLKGVAQAGAIAFAALTAEVFLSVQAFSEAEAASRKLSQSLQNQGIYSKELVDTYKSYAAEVQKTTGIDDDAVVTSQAVAQSYLGQTKVTKELTMAIADLSEEYGGDLNSAAAAIGRTIGTSTNAFARQGLEIKSTATEAERMDTVLKFVNTRFGGLAEQANKGLGGVRGLQNAFGNFQEGIGERFAPMIESVIGSFTRFFTALSENDAFLDLTVAAIAFIGTLSGLAVAVPGIIIGIAALKAAVVALGVTFNAAFVGIPLLIGAVVAGVALLALNWGAVTKFIQAATTAMVDNVSTLLGGLGDVLLGVFTLDGAQIEKGLSAIKNAFIKSVDDFKTIRAQQNAEEDAAQAEQDAKKKAAADKAAAEKRSSQLLLARIEKEGLALIVAEQQGASKDYLDLKRQEIETLKQLEQAKTRTEIDALNERLGLIRAREDEQRAQDLERMVAFEAERQEVSAELAAQGVEIDANLSLQQQEALRASLMTEREIEQSVEAEKLATRINARNQELIDRKKYGETIAVINAALGSKEVQGAKAAAGELVQLTQSKNATLKSIGKAAALAQIAIKTPESAMNIYAGFSTIPIIGPALGIVGAAAAVAFGAEQAATVVAANKGGVIPGSGADRDSVLGFVTPGELVVPKQDFRQVVGAVQGESLMPSVLGVLTAILEKVGTGGNTTILNGDLLADEAFIDRIVRGVSDAIEFRNAKIFGVNA